MAMRRIVSVVLAGTIAVLALATPVAAGDGDGRGGETSGLGLQGHELEFTVKSKDADQACVSYYETTKKKGPAKHFERVQNKLVELPFTTTVGATAKAKHWAIAAWATNDCAATTDPDGAVQCSVKVDGDRKAKKSATDAIAFCFV
jgi:hypothetical protein